MQQVPDSEFQGRIEKLRKAARQEGYDALLIHSNEADFANVRYLTNYWPAFESAGVFLPVEGQAMLLVGPESEDYARDRSRLRPIRKLTVYRESAEPEYPGVAVDTFQSIFETSDRPIRRLGIIGWSILPHIVFQQVATALPDVEINKADALMTSLRSIKSDNELAMLREANRISEIAIEAVIDAVKPGVTELELVGVAQEAIYRNGAEYEGMPLYIFSGKATTNAISRPRQRPLKQGELLQLNIGARVEGYSSSVGRPVFLGKMPLSVRHLVEGALQAHFATMEWMKAGVPAATIAKKYYQYLTDKGLQEYFLYGPCHGLGMMEVEQPWVETSSKYNLQENMTFQVDSFLRTDNYGCRWEDGVRITPNGVEMFSDKRLELIEIEE